MMAAWRNTWLKRMLDHEKIEKANFSVLVNIFLDMVLEEFWTEYAKKLEKEILKDLPDRQKVANEWFTKAISETKTNVRP